MHLEADDGLVVELTASPVLVRLGRRRGLEAGGDPHHHRLAEGGGEDLHADREARRGSSANGTLTAGWPARFDGMVQRSHRYISIGSSTFEPKGKATDGVVGVNSTSKVL